MLIFNGAVTDKKCLVTSCGQGKRFMALQGTWVTPYFVSALWADCYKSGLDRHFLCVLTGFLLLPFFKKIFLNTWIIFRNVVHKTKFDLTLIVFFHIFCLLNSYLLEPLLSLFANSHPILRGFSSSFFHCLTDFNVVLEPHCKQSHTVLANASCKILHAHL